ncbi:MAG: acyltransferase family protein [Colwellia sp.]
MKRIIGLDLARGLAIFLAMSSHTLSSLNYDAPIYVNLLFRTATPLFIVVFGFFLHCIYLRKLHEIGFQFVKKKLWTRAIQCFVLHSISCIVLAYFSQFSLVYTLRMILFMGATPFTDILKYYTLILLLAPYLLLFISRYGLKHALWLSCLPHLLSYFSLLKPILILPYDEIVTAMLYGGGDVIAGPSIIHSFIFILFGFYLSIKMQSEHSFTSLIGSKGDRSILWLALFLALSLLTLLITGNVTGEMLSNMSLRNSNAYPYFIFGCLFSFVMIECCLMISNKVRRYYLQPLLLFGTSSLILFSFGNWFLYAIAEVFSFSFLSYVLILSFFSLICYMNLYLNKIKSQRFQRLFYYVSIGYVKFVIK